MLKAKVLNSDATLNNFEVISALDFIPGDAATLVIQLFQPQRKDGLRYFAATGATLSVFIPKTDGSELEVEMETMADHSIWSADLTADDTEDLVGGNFTFELTEGLKTTKGWVENGLAVVITGNC
jgi:hypothetical protein